MIGPIMERAARIGMKIAFKVAPMDTRVSSYPLEKMRWLIVNEIEGAALANVGNEHRMLQVLYAHYPNTAILLTLGDQGCRYWDGNVKIDMPAFRVENVVDTTAAGDVFVGYFLASMMRGNTAEQALRHANAAGALAIQKQGAATSIPDAVEVANYLGTGYAAAT